MPTDWHPCALLGGNPTHPYAVIVLNQPLNRHALNAVIDSAALLVCADGGADRLRRYDSDVRNRLKHRVPDAIVGDLDSLTQDTEAHYRSKGVQVVKDPDQGSTDFTKCLKWLRTHAVSRGVDSGGGGSGGGDDQHLDVVVLGGLGGRVDQGFSQIHHLYLAANDKSLLNGRIYLLSEQSLSFVLSEERNTVHIEPGYFEQNIGIIPVTGRASITTKGLEWDVSDWDTAFGGQISTSNHIRSDKIDISFTGPNPLLTLELAARLTSAGE